MAERKQSFRFRMPWGPSGQQQPSAPKPPQAPPPPSTQASSLGVNARSRTATPSESAQSRSAPEQSQSPSRGTKQSRPASSQPPPPARASPEPAQAAPNLPPSPSRGSKQSPAASEQIPKRSPGATTSPIPEKSDSSTVTAEGRREDRVEEKEIVQSPSDKEKINEVITEEPIQKKTVTELPTSESDENHPQNAEIQNGSQTHLQREIKDEISNFVQKITTQPPKSNLEDNPNPVSVITLAGESKGASMQLGSGSSEEGDEIKIYRGYKATKPEDTTDDGERNYKEKNPKTPSPEDPPAKAYININIQGSNNSIMYNSSITERDPGVQLFLTRNQGTKAEGKEKKEGMEARKSEFRATPVQKMTYEPVVRRRCLGGLMMEPSDSDPDDPEKPRRHGCKFAFKEENKDSENDV
ncbi:hypothetical protein NMG60_11024360 [Bertholletia excelsa]